MKHSWIQTFNAYLGFKMAIRNTGWIFQKGSYFDEALLKKMPRKIKVKP